MKKRVKKARTFLTVLMSLLLAVYQPLVSLGEGHSGQTAKKGAEETVKTGVPGGFWTKEDGLWYHMDERGNKQSG